MFLLYLDESGNENDPTDRYFVLGGVALFERQTYFLTRALDEVQEKHFPNSPPVPFHASHIRAGKGFWRKIAPATREAVLQGLVRALQDSPDAGRVERSRKEYVRALSRVPSGTRIPGNERVG